MEKSNPMAPFVDVIHIRWWQSRKPPIPTHSIANDLSVINALRGQGWGDDELVGALGEYEGPPSTLLIFWKRGNRHILEELRGRWLKRCSGSNKKENDLVHISEILREMVR